MKLFYCLILSVLLLTCSSRKMFDHGYFSIGTSNGILDSPEIDEASGIASSKVNRGMFWIHNDSGDEARIFLIDNKGHLKVTVHFKDLKNRDWEDIAVGPGPEKGVSYVYIGEIGDNLGIHKHKYIYRVEEPDLKKAIRLNRRDTTVSSVDSIKFELSDHARDAEALMIDPTTKNLYVISKRDPEVNVYILPYPQSTTSSTTARIAMQLPYTQIVAADISSNGKEVLIKSYKDVFYWRKEKKESLEELLKKEPKHLPYAVEPQGEAITFDRSGKGYYTVSEEANQKKPHLMFYERKQ